MNFITTLLQSRKFLQVSAGAGAGGILFLLPVFVSLLGADKAASTIQHSADVMAGVAVVLGALLALLTAVEDCARKLGVTVPPESEPVRAKIQEIENRLEEMAKFTREIPQATKK